MNLKTHRSITEILLWLAPVCFLLLFYFYPLGSILNLSLARSQQGLISPFFQAFSSPIPWRALGFTFWQAILSTIFTLALGLPGAYLFAHYNFRGKSLLQALTGIPFLMPTLVVAAAFNALLGPNGWLNIGLMQAFKLTNPPLQFTNSLIAILVAHVFYNTTIILRMVGDFWSHLDPRTGSGSSRVGCQPLASYALGDYSIAYPCHCCCCITRLYFRFHFFWCNSHFRRTRFATLEVEIYYQTISLFNLPLAAVLSILQLACTFGFTILYTRLIRHLSIPLSLKSRVVTQRRLTSHRSKLMAGMIIVTLLTLLILPLASLAVRSVTRLEPNRGEPTVVSPGFTLDFYHALEINNNDSIFFAPPSTAIAVSLGYALATTVLALLLGFPAALALSL